MLNQIFLFLLTTRMLLFGRSLFPPPHIKNNLVSSIALAEKQLNTNKKRHLSVNGCGVDFEFCLDNEASLSSPSQDVVSLLHFRILYKNSKFSMSNLGIKGVLYKDQHSDKQRLFFYKKSVNKNRSDHPLPDF